LYRLSTFTGLSKSNIRQLSKSKNNLNKIISNTLVFRVMTSFLGILIGLSVLCFVNYTSTVNKGIIIFFIYLLLFSISDTLKSIIVSSIDFKKISQFEIIKTTIQVLLSVVILNMGYGILHLVFIYLAVELLNVILFYNEVREKVDFKLIFNDFSKKNLFNKGYKFSLIEFLNLLSSRIDIFMLSVLTDPVSLGVYALANTISRKGLIIRRAIQQPLFPHYSNKTINKNSFRMLNKHFLLISMASTFIVLIIYFLSDKVIPFIVGDEFMYSSEILKVLAFYLLFHYAVMPFSTFIEAQKHESLALKIGAFRASINLICNLLFFNLFGIIGIAYSTVLVWALNFLFFYILSFKTIHYALK
jgi:O-antigen/teichoic acid export membrane protein